MPTLHRRKVHGANDRRRPVILREDDDEKCHSAGESVMARDAKQFDNYRSHEGGKVSWTWTFANLHANLRLVVSLFSRMQIAGINPYFTSGGRYRWLDGTPAPSRRRLFMRRIRRVRQVSRRTGSWRTGGCCNPEKFAGLRGTPFLNARFCASKEIERATRQSASYYAIPDTLPTPI